MMENQRVSGSMFLLSLTAGGRMKVDNVRKI